MHVPHLTVERQNKKAAAGKRPTADELAKHATTLKKAVQQKPLAPKPETEDNSMQGVMQRAFKARFAQARDDEEEVVEEEDEGWDDGEQPLQVRKISMVTS